MMLLLELKENLKEFYARFAIIINGLAKFLLSLLAVMLLNGNLGFMSRLGNPVFMAVLALMCAFLPYGAVSIVLACVMIAHIYVVSFEIALLTAAFLIMVALLYYGLQTQDIVWLILTPVAFMLKIPYVIPLLAGLAGTLSCIFPVSFGIVIYYVVLYVKQNAGILANDASVDITLKYSQIIRSLMSNRSMLVFLVVCAAGILAVNLLHRLSIDHAWGVAISVGTVTQLIVVFTGDLLFDVSIPLMELVPGLVVSLIIALIYHFFVFTVDYTRTEYTQFEDDDYVYYVKAVPKMAVSKSDVRVQRINNPRGQRFSNRAEKNEEQ